MSAANEAPEVLSPPALARRAALGDFADDVQQWLSDSFRRYVLEGVPIETALRLDRASRLRARDEALRRAADLLALGDGPWNAARRLAQAVARHERQRDAPTTPLESAVAAAFAAGVRVPESARQIYAIVC